MDKPKPVAIAVASRLEGRSHDVQAMSRANAIYWQQHLPCKDQEKKRGKKKLVVEVGQLDPVLRNFRSDSVDVHLVAAAATEQLSLLLLLLLLLVATAAAAVVAAGQPGPLAPRPRGGGGHAGAASSAAGSAGTGAGPAPAAGALAAAPAAAAGLLIPVPVLPVVPLPPPPYRKAYALVAPIFVPHHMLIHFT